MAVEIKIFPYVKETQNDIFVSGNLVIDESDGEIIMVTPSESIGFMYFDGVIIYSSVSSNIGRHVTDCTKKKYTQFKGTIQLKSE